MKIFIEIMSTRTRRTAGRVAAAKAKSAISELSPPTSGAVLVDKPEKQNRKRGRPKVAGPANDTVAESDGKSPYFESKTAAPPTPAVSKSKKSKLKAKAEAKLGKTFYDQDTLILAKAMLGKVLCRKLPESGEIVKGTIVETEAYPGVGDAASYSSKGVPTPASMPMFMDPGTAFVYMTYGMYHCFNISAKEYGGAVLLRALEVLEDYEIMQTLRNPKKKKLENQDTTPAKNFKRHELANGPSKLCLSFNISKDICNKIDMNVSDDLWIENSTDLKYLQQQFEIERSKRVGIDRTPPEARNQLYRFFVKDNSSVSKAKFKSDATVGSSKGRKGKK